jgi:anti-sigma factor RsiW
MTHDVIRHLLGDYVTGELPEDARAPVADHIAACAICAAEVESLNTILARAADLPKSIDPPAEAWSNIRAAIERDKKAVATHRVRSTAGFWRRPYVLAAAAVVLMLLSSGGTAIYMRGRGNDSDSSRSASMNPGATPASLAAFTIEENNYLRNVAVLQDLLDQQEASLAPETVAQLKGATRSPATPPTRC